MRTRIRYSRRASQNSQTKRQGLYETGSTMYRVRIKSHLTPWSLIDTKRKWKVVTYAAYFARKETHFRLSGFPGQSTRPSSKGRLDKINRRQSEEVKMTASWAFRLCSKQNKLWSNFYIGTETSAPEYVVQEGKWEKSRHMLYNHRRLDMLHTVYMKQNTSVADSK